MVDRIGGPPDSGTPRFKKVSETEQFWQGQGDPRPLQICRPCSCGCDMRGRTTGVGYITGATDENKGFTIWIEEEETFLRLKEAFEAHIIPPDEKFDPHAD
jgi:hypothetical protein